MIISRYSRTLQLVVFFGCLLALWKVPLQEADVSYWSDRYWLGRYSYWGVVFTGSSRWVWFQGKHDGNSVSNKKWDKITTWKQQRFWSAWVIALYHQHLCCSYHNTLFKMHAWVKCAFLFVYFVVDVFFISTCHNSILKIIADKAECIRNKHLLDANAEKMFCCS